MSDDKDEKYREGYSAGLRNAAADAWDQDINAGYQAGKARRESEEGQQNGDAAASSPSATKGHDVVGSGAAAGMALGGMAREFGARTFLGALGVIAIFLEGLVLCFSLGGLVWGKTHLGGIALGLVSMAAYLWLSREPRVGAILKYLVMLSLPAYTYIYMPTKYSITKAAWTKLTIMNLVFAALAYFLHSRANREIALTRAELEDGKGPGSGGARR